MKVLMIGAGNIGRPYAEGMSASSLLRDDNFQIYDRNEHKLQVIEKEGILRTFRMLKDCLPYADIVFLAVKPDQIDKLFSEMRPLINNSQVFVSIMAGVRINTVMDGLHIQKVIRAMPNLPAKIGKGVTCFTNSKYIAQKELDNVRSLINMTGSAIHVKNENFINASTAISGSGPAYVFYFIQVLINSLVKTGYSPTSARILATRIFENASQILAEYEQSPKELLVELTKKDQSLKQAINQMDKTKINTLIQEGIFAAYRRAIELGKLNKK